ncbi:FecCD family ABC transporter permease [Burkholderia perseverans]|uniref:FecCD family ABC transporter permease n=1 Tax=Burkholderia perseverans TaxID=2615214 RepID=UPI001FEFB272|nr:iron ABC transporter permease [Burkholderia perseverans]
MFGIACASVAIAALIALCAGRFPLTPMQVARAFIGTAGAPHSAASLAQWHAIVVGERLPRLLAAALAGAALASGGATYQAVFRNALVSPGWLGVLSGAAFGAALGIITGGAVPNLWWVQLCAFAAGCTAMALGVALAWLLGGGGTLALLLGGLVSNALFSALLALVKYVADPLDQLPAIVYWLLGSLAQVGWHDLARLGPPLAIGTALLCAAAPLLDALSQSDDEALSLGVPVRRIRLAVITVATLATALTVSLGGMIGWVGLLVPHLARALAGASNRAVLPVSALLGATVLILADTIARSATASEIPLGVITEIAGAAAFGFVLVRQRGRLAR